MRIVTVLLVCSALLVLISAMDKTVEEKRREEEKISNRELVDNVEEQRSLHQRQRRALKNNSSPDLAGIEKRLKAIEER